VAFEISTSPFARVIKLQLDRYGPVEAKRRHIEAARAGLGAYLGTQTPKPAVRLEVDGHAATSEDQVKPFGIIIYRFQRMHEVVPYALMKAREFSPVGTKTDARPGHPGLYRESWFALVDGRVVQAGEVAPDDEVTITNNQPYSRKINTGAKGYERYAPPGVVEKTRQAVLAKYGATVDAHIVFLDLEGGYVLRRDLQHIHGGRRYGSPRRDARAGMPITYPALIMTPKDFG
jgi:hypothetical protein